MPSYRAEADAELLFNFPEDLTWSELDKQGVKLPVKMKFVDLVIEREGDILLVEIKDPSHSRSPDKERNSYLKRLTNNSVLADELTPKARDSYLYLHLMERDNKPLKYVVVLGLDAFDPEIQKGVMYGFKDRLLAGIREESFEAWKRKHIADCVVLSVDSWNQQFPAWPVRREAPAAVDAPLEVAQ
jgi:myo-inositol catabolism protein IolC